jgi:hypothetical protein
MTSIRLTHKNALYVLLSRRNNALSILWEDIIDGYT